MHSKNNQLPPDWPLMRSVLMMVLRRQWIVFVRGNLIAANRATIYAGIMGDCPWGQ
jgi:hypothetical protein